MEARLAVGLMVAARAEAGGVGGRGGAKKRPGGSFRGKAPRVEHWKQGCLEEEEQPAVQVEVTELGR